MFRLSRHTTQRQLVLLAVKSGSGLMSAQQVLERVRSNAPRIGSATVYRNLDVLTRRAEIGAVEGDDGVRRFVGHAHHEATFRCLRCGKIRSLDSRTMRGFVQRKMPGRQVVFFSKLSAQGLCASCARALGSR